MNSTDYRKIIGHFATGVTVITTRVESSYHGMTANAVCSVSLDPLLLLVCIDRKATCHEQVTAAGRFGVNVLTAQQEEISNAFAKPQEPNQGCLLGVEQVVSESGVPLIAHSLAHLVCRVVDQFDGGDHSIFVGEVVEGSAAESGQEGSAPLLYYAGEYRGLSPRS